MLQHTDFKVLYEFINTHEKIASNLEINYTFNCNNLTTQQHVLIFLLVAYSFTFILSFTWLCYLKYKNMLKRRHTNLIFTSFVLVLTSISFFSHLFIYLYGQKCPWSVEWQKIINLLDAAKALLSTIIKAFIVFMTMSIVYGYDVIVANVTQNILKQVFVLTIVKFFLYQFERALSGV